MFDFGVEVFDRAGAALPVSPDLLLLPQPWTGAALGGPKTAEITATGSRAALKNILLNWLGFAVTITTPTGGPCWWGYVHEVALAIDGVEITATLENLRNRVAVTYTALEGAVEEAQTTAWADDLASQAQFGVREHFESLGQAATGMATAYRDRLLADGAWPRLGSTLALGGELAATLRCRGFYARAGWRYYRRSDGRLEHMVGDTQVQPIGWGISASNQVGFGDGAIHDAAGRLADLAPGMKLAVTGSTSNNKTFTVLDGTAEEVETYSNNSIYFEPADDIFDAFAGMSMVKTEHWLLVAGSAANSRWHRVGAAGADHLRTSSSVSGTIVTEAAGPTITLTQAQRMTTAETATYEAPGAGTVTVTLHGQQVAQRFTPATAMQVDRVMIEAAVTGTPGDNLEVRILADSGGAPGALLTSGALAAGSLTDTLTAVWVTLAGTVTLAAGTNYWFQVRRSGSLDGAHYFRVGMTTTAYGASRMWTGAAWVAHAPGWFLHFRLWAVEDTGTMAETLLAATMQGVTVQTGFTSGVNGFPTMDSQAGAGDELERLVGIGTAAARRVLADITPERVMRLYEQPLPNAATMPVLRTAGGRLELFDAAGSPWPAGILPAGQWVELGDIDSDLTAVGGLSPAFVDEAAYDPQANSWSIEFGGRRSLADMLKVQAG